MVNRGVAPAGEFQRPVPAGMVEGTGFGFERAPMQRAQEHGLGNGHANGNMTPHQGHMHMQARTQNLAGSGVYPQQKKQLEGHQSSQPFAFGALPLPIERVSAAGVGPFSFFGGPSGPASMPLTAPIGNASEAGLNMPRKASTSSNPAASDQASEVAASTTDLGVTASGGLASATTALSLANSLKGRHAGGASDFVKKLYKMLEEDQYRSIVAWGPKGDSFIVKDMNEFTKTVLPHHFKHSNFASFVRQLNKYDFHKVKTHELNSEVIGENYWEFKHPSFSVDMKHSLENIRRKITTSKKPETPAVTATGASSVPPGGNSENLANGPSGMNAIPHGLQAAPDFDLLANQISNLRHNQQQTELYMARFTDQFHALMADLFGQHQATAAHDAFTATILQYIVNLESRLLSFTNPAEALTFPPSAEAQHLMATFSDLSRARYDKMTEITRRADALKAFVDANVRQSDSPLNGTVTPSPEFAAADLPYDLHHQQPHHMHHSLPLHMQPHLHQHHLQHRQHQSIGPAHHQPRHPYFMPQNLKQQRTGSPQTPNAIDPLGESHPAFSSLGEIRLGAHAGEPSTPVSGIASNKPGDTGASYFPTPGAPVLRSSTAITPGALMISTLDNTNHSYASDPLTNRDHSEEGLTPNSGLTAVNTSRNQNLTYLAEGEDIAAFAAALKGGQSSAAVRSALTSQPLLVRRATYIPGWSVPPRVLLVEDDPVCRNLTTKFLDLFGCTIEVARDGVEAVSKMQNGVYDICMMDVSMPNLDGVSATSLIRQFDAMTPIISMTGNSRPDEIHTYFSHGMNDVLPKPFTKEGMLSMLEKHLLHLKQIHQNPEMAPLLEDIDLDNLDFSSENPFRPLGISNDDYRALLSGSGMPVMSGRLSASPATSSGQLAGPEKRGPEDSGDRDVSSKRTRFKEA